MQVRQTDRRRSTTLASCGKERSGFVSRQRWHTFVGAASAGAGRRDTAVRRIATAVAVAYDRSGEGGRKYRVLRPCLSSRARTSHATSIARPASTSSSEAGSLTARPTPACTSIRSRPSANRSGEPRRTLSASAERSASVGARAAAEAAHGAAGRIYPARNSSSIALTRASRPSTCRARSGKRV